MKKASKKEISKDIEVLRLVGEVKGLEGSLRKPGAFPVMDMDVAHLGGLLKMGLTEQEVNDFIKGYNNFVGTYVSQIISNRFNGIQEKYKGVLQGTPEETYVANLSRGAINSEANILDTDVGNLGFSVRVVNSLKAERIYHLGQLVQREEGGLLRIPNLGKGSLGEIKEALASRNLRLGMKVSYFPQEGE